MVCSQMAVVPQEAYLSRLMRLLGLTFSIAVTRMMNVMGTAMGHQRENVIFNFVVVWQMFAACKINSQRGCFAWMLVTYTVLLLWHLEEMLLEMQEGIVIVKNKILRLKSSKLEKILLCFFGWVMFTACDSGYGVAGASMDSKMSLNEVENFKVFVDGEYAREVVKNRGCSDVPWIKFGDKVKNPYKIAQFGEEIFLNGKSYRFSNSPYFEVGEVGSSESFVMRNIPKVFVGRPGVLAVFDGGKYWVVLISSRASTAKFYILIFNFLGSVIYENVLDKVDFYGHIDFRDDVFKINGKCVIREISLNTSN